MLIIDTIYKEIVLLGPVFVFQWQFDEAQMTVDNVGAPVTPQQWNYIHIQGYTNSRRIMMNQ